MEIFTKYLYIPTISQTVDVDTLQLLLPSSLDNYEKFT